MEQLFCGLKIISQIGNKQQNSYINDLVNACNLSNPYLFADDGALLFENICQKTYLSIRIEMLTILKWLNVNKLSLNVDNKNINF